jgi:hypothetical protein
VRIRGNVVQRAEDGSYDFARAIGGNDCDDGRCSRRGTQRFYLTKTTFDGGQALNACSEGYHMASMWEIHDVSHLEYDTIRGHDVGDGGSGPPTGLFSWVRTGAPAANSGPIGGSNCNAWAPGMTDGSGTFARLEDTWGFDVAHSWSSGGGSCGDARPVWCVED